MWKWRFGHRDTSLLLSLMGEDSFWMYHEAFHLWQISTNLSKTPECGFFKKLAYANGFPFGLPLTYLLVSLWLPFWPTLGHVSSIHVAQVRRAHGYSTSTHTLVTVPISESKVGATLVYQVCTRWHVQSHSKQPFFNWGKKCSPSAPSSIDVTDSVAMWVFFQKGAEDVSTWWIWLMKVDVSYRCNFKWEVRSYHRHPMKVKKNLNCF